MIISPLSVLQYLLHLAHLSFTIFPFESTLVAQYGPFPSIEVAHDWYVLPLCLNGNTQSWALPSPLPYALPWPSALQIVHSAIDHSKVYYYNISMDNENSEILKLTISIMFAKFIATSPINQTSFRVYFCCTIVILSNVFIVSPNLTSCTSNIFLIIMNEWKYTVIGITFFDVFVTLAIGFTCLMST